jgi:hypothetical protein
MVVAVAFSLVGPPFSPSSRRPLARKAASVVMGHDAFAAAAKREMHCASLLRHRRIASADDVCIAAPVMSTWTGTRGRLLTRHTTSALLDGAGDALPPPSLAATWVVPTTGLPNDFYAG